ncbi:MAG: hypothetical protein ACXWGU_10280 [Usitatibacter sp.]
MATRKTAARKPATRRPARRKPEAPRSAARKPTVRKAPARRPKSSPEGRVARASRAAKNLRLAGVGSEAVQRATGRMWDEWLTVLDRAGAKSMPHKEIALMLSRKFEVPDWWSQMVTVGYEQARGLRLVNQNAKGFAANASRTVATGVRHLFDAWSDPKMRARWLADAPLEVRRSTDGKSIRMTWTAGGSDVDVGLFSKGANKSSVQVQHGKLRSGAAVARQKAYWSEALDRLKALLEPVT